MIFQKDLACSEHRKSGRQVVFSHLDLTFLQTPSCALILVVAWHGIHLDLFFLIEKCCPLLPIRFYYIQVQNFPPLNFSPTFHHGNICIFLKTLKMLRFKIRNFTLARFALFFFCWVFFPGLVAKLFLQETPPCLHPLKSFSDNSLLPRPVKVLCVM